MLTRITVASAQRRVDVVLPDEVPVAELLPDLVQRAGDGLADRGQQHGGWALHRFGGPKLAATDSMATAGIADGEVLHLVPARTDWPEPEYDDVVDAVAIGARGLGARWSGGATRVAAVAAAGVILMVGLAGAGSPHDRWGVPGLAAVLLAAGILATRAYAEPLVGAALAAYSLPAAALGGWHLLESGADTASHMLVAATALTLWSVAGALGAAAGQWIFIAGTATGLLGVIGASASFVTGTARAAALISVVVVGGVAAAPSLAVRLGRLPMPVVTPPPGTTGTTALAEQPGRDRVLAAVARADAMLTGLLTGLAVTAAAAGWALQPAGLAGPLLTVVAGLTLLLRARLLVTVRQRTPLLAGGAALLVLPVAAGTWTLGPLAAPTLSLVVVGLAVAGVRYRRRSPSPYLGRAADILDTLCLVSVVPLAAAVLNLYATMRGLSG